MTVLECLDQVSGDWKPSSSQLDEGVVEMDEDDWHFTLTVSRSSYAVPRSDATPC